MLGIVVDSGGAHGIDASRVLLVIGEGIALYIAFCAAGACLICGWAARTERRERARRQPSRK